MIGTRVNVETHADAAVFEQLADEWNELLKPTCPEAVFTRAEWQGLWWRHLGRGDLHVMTVRDDAGKLVGIAPLLVEDVAGGPTLSFVGCVDVADYLDVLAAPRHSEAMLAAVIDHLDGDGAPDWDMMDLCSIPEGSPTLEILPRLARAKGWQAEVGLHEVVPVIHLPGDFDAYLEALEGKQRRELRRKLRRAESWPGGTDWYTVGPEHDLQEEVDAFLTLMAMSAPEKADFLAAPGHRAFMKELAQLAHELGWLRLQFLRVGGERAAGLFNLVYADRQMVYNSGFNFEDYGPISPGWVLFGYSIQDAIARGLSVYDFLRGDEDYKLRLGGQPTAVHRLVVRRL